MIYTDLYVMFLMQPDPQLGQVGGGGWALETSIYLGPKWYSPNGSMTFNRAQKTLDFQGQTPLSLAPVMDLHASKTVSTGPYKS